MLLEMLKMGLLLRLVRVLLIVFKGMLLLHWQLLCDEGCGVVTRHGHGDRLSLLRWMRLMGERETEGYLSIDGEIVARHGEIFGQDGALVCLGIVECFLCGDIDDAQESFSRI